MHKIFRTHSKKTPEFHHYDIPKSILNHTAFNVADLMQQKNHLLVQSGSAHCRITFCQQFKNFKIIRPDEIDNEHWQKIKKLGEKLVQQHFDWYTSPLPRTAPASLQKTFLYDFLINTREDGEAKDTKEEEIYALWCEMDSIVDTIKMLEYYFDHFPAMRSHPMLFAIICGHTVPTMQDLTILMHFKSIFTVASINAIYDSILNMPYAYEFCKELFKKNIYPQLSDVDGHLTFEIPSLKLQNQVVDLLRHDLNVDLLVLRAFSKEALFLKRANPGHAYMLRVLPSHIYKFFDLQDRVKYLSNTEFWHDYHYTQILCSGPDRQRHQDIPIQKLQSFSVCNSCVVQCARAKINCNWVSIYSAIPTIRTAERKNVDCAPRKNYEKAATSKRQYSPEPVGYQPQREKRARITFTDDPRKKSEVPSETSTVNMTQNSSNNSETKIVSNGNDEEEKYLYDFD